MNRLFLIISPLLFLCGCTQRQETTPTYFDDIDTEGLVTQDTVGTKERDEQIAKELEYYLDRHNVRDEGFDMVIRYAEDGDSTQAIYLPKGRAMARNLMHWQHGRRQGKGVTTDRQGRLIIGMFNADTLVSGIRMDEKGIYAGMMNSAMEACGHGSYRSVDGSFYEGHWQHDQREGFGFSVSTAHLKAGQWSRDAFRGERMHYTSERIYGIDISRYQHEIGRRRFPIDWAHLRITNMGRRISSQRVDGDANYPVSFVYIKSTQGATITNRYFATDYQNARKQNIRVGAYHFFTVGKDAREQAHYFLKNTQFKKGDLPPMLDIEPTDAMIRKGGGPKKMFSDIRTWLNIVERATHTRPLLYVNQRFINTYLDQAPDLKEKYLFWIARYGEYKPDVRLALWQLSDCGRVRGIQGDVDLNVFNGYQIHWDDFLSEETIK